MNTSETGVVHLGDLSEKEVCLGIKEEYLKSMLETAKKLANGKWINIPKKLNLPIPKDGFSTPIRSMRRKNVVGLDVLKKLSYFLVSNGHNKFSLENIEKNLLFLKSRMGNAGAITNPKFPMNFNSVEGVHVVSCLLHDGGIDTRNLEPFYSNLNKELKEDFYLSVKKVAGEIGLISESHLYKEIVFPKILGIILVSLGLVPGKRQINNPKFPKFILDLSKELKFKFLSHAIADDGWVYNPKNGFGYVSFNFTIDLTRFSKEERQRIRKEKDLQYLPNVLVGDMNLFRGVGCEIEGPYFGNEKLYYDENNKERRYTQEWKMNIRDFRSLNILRKSLKIPLMYKQKKLGEISRKQRKQSILRYEILVALNKLGKATKFEVSEDTGLTLRRIVYNLKIFEKMGLVNTKSFKNDYYSLTKKGIEEADIFN